MSDGSEFDCKGGCGARTANLTGTCTHCQKRQREAAIRSGFVPPADSEGEEDQKP